MTGSMVSLKVLDVSESAVLGRHLEVEGAGEVQRRRATKGRGRLIETSQGGSGDPIRQTGHIGQAGAVRVDERIGGQGEQPRRIFRD